MKKAWQLERELRDAAIPLDRRIHDSNWYDSDFEPPFGDALIDMFWFSRVPGSGAPEIPYQEMIQAKANKGYDLSKAEELIAEGIQLHKEKKIPELRQHTARILAELVKAPIDSSHPYHQFEHPKTWDDVKASMKIKEENQSDWSDDFSKKIYNGWVGQLAGGSFGTAIEGYTGEQIKKVYGKVDYYITEPETLNDDVVYELIFLDVLERMGKEITSEEIGLEWVKQIVFGWSAEWIALRNLNQGIMAPESGSYQNPYSDWIGAQMRQMICGLVAPAQPMEAARLAYTDSLVSHADNGAYGGMFAAVLTSLAFTINDTKKIIEEAINYIPQNSEYKHIIDQVLKICHSESDPKTAWRLISPIFEKYNWIHAYPNIAGVIYALWYGENDFTETMALLAHAGNDVDCSAGLAGTVLGVINPIPNKWSEPIGDLLETYIKGKEQLSVRELAKTTAELAQKMY